MDRYGPTLLGRLRRRARTCRFGDAHVDDVFQEALLRLVHPDVRQEIRHAGGSILPWLTRLGYWRLNDEYRGDLRRRSMEGVEELVRTGDPPGELSEMAHAVEDMLLEMSPRDELILRQHYGEGMSCAEIGQSVGITKAAAKKAVHDAKARLRHRLEGAGHTLKEAADG
jgi:RNA polymerase sigma factor (sigma-70 family)